MSMNDEEKQLRPTNTTPTTSVSPRVWRSCCFDCDRDVVQYVTKTLFAGTILGFACIQIATNEDPCNPLMSWYTSMIGLVAGSYIEQASSNVTRNEPE